MPHKYFVASGPGTIYTFAVIHQDQMPGFREAGPFVLAHLELEEGPRLMSNVVGCEPDGVEIGMPARLEFAPPPAADEGFAVPRSRPA